MSAYRVSGHGGVAWTLLGHPKKEPMQWFVPFTDDPESDGFWEVEDDPPEDTDRVEMVMVGDDRVFVFDADEITLLDEDEYCPGCGQIGCGAYG